MRVKTISFAVFCDNAPLVRTVRCRTVAKTVVDSTGTFSEQIDVVIHDRQYTPLVFTFKDKHVVPAESVYAVFECKQEMNANHIVYAQKKIASVRKLHRTSLPVPTIDGTKKAKELTPVLGGILTLSCKWSPVFGGTMLGYLKAGPGNKRLDVGCVADSGNLWFTEDGGYTLAEETKPVTRFLLELMSRLQAVATVPMIDMRAYAKSWNNADHLLAYIAILHIIRDGRAWRLR